MNGLVRLFIKVSLIVAAAMVPLIMGDKLAGAISSKIQGLTANAKKSAQQRAADRLAVKKGTGSAFWSPISSSKAWMGRQMRQAGLANNRAGRATADWLQSSKDRQKSAAFDIAEKQRKSRPYVRSEAEERLRTGGKGVRKEALLELATRGDLEGLADIHNPANHRALTDIAHHIGTGDGELFKTLKDNNPDALVAAVLHLATNQEAREELNGRGVDVENTVNTLHGQAQAAIRDMTPQKFNSWAASGLRNTANIQNQARNATGLSENSQQQVESIRSFIPRIVDEQRLEYILYSRDYNAKASRNALFNADNNTGRYTSIRDEFLQPEVMTQQQISLMNYFLQHQGDVTAMPSDLNRPNNYNPGGGGPVEGNVVPGPGHPQYQGRGNRPGGNRPGGGNAQQPPAA